MNVWKQALWLSRFEVRASLKSFLILFIIAIFYGLFFSISFAEFDFFVNDLFFIFIFWSMSNVVRPKVFTLQKISDGVWAAPFVVMLNQLPIQKNVLIISRFITYFIFSIPFHLLMLIFIYTFSADLREIVSAGSFIAFSIIWICYGVASGSMFPASEIGDKAPKNNLVLSALGILFYGGVLGIIIVINIFSSRSIVSWSIYAVNERPFVSSFLSCVIAILVVGYYTRYMRKKMDKIDFLK
ncbi:hypothetical protein KDN24_25565 [Bacillus sp. Bva_UNVM-123]|uniref:hypothetical protein n=1 Tax=Bacillus sp. Bva_UNVM-123 TaxID=2829798 RepID=UPI00391FB9DD